MLIKGEYIETTFSDLGNIVLLYFKFEKKWFADESKLPKTSPIKACINDCVWSAAKAIEDFASNWHKLNLIPCYDVLDTIRIHISDMYVWGQVQLYAAQQSDKPHQRPNKHSHFHPKSHEQLV